MSSIPVAEAQDKYKAKDEAQLLQKMAEEYDCDRIYKYSNGTPDRETLTDYKVILKPSHESGLLTSGSVFNAVLVYDAGEVILPGRTPTISFTCRHCEKKLKAPYTGAGKSLACPNCKAKSTVPPFVARGELAATQFVADKRIKIECPKCAKSMTSKAESVGKTTKCPGCGETFEIREE